MRLIFLRHGESAGNITQLLQGRDDPLTDRGRRQARQLARFLQTRADVRAIYTSPLARALETSRIIGAAIGVEPEPRAGLAEIDVGEAVGLTLDDWAARFPDEAERFHRDGLDFQFRGGESGRQLGARVAAEIDRIVAEHRGATGVVAVVSHGGALAWALGHLLGDALDSWPVYRFDNCSLTEIELDDNAGFPASVICRNEVGHLEAEPDEEIATGQA